MRPNLYGLTLAASVFIAWILARRLAPKFGLKKQDVDDLLPWLVISGILGARLYFVIFSWDYFQNHLWEIPKIWHGGLAIYGAIIGGTGGILGYARTKGISFWRLADLVAIVVPLGQAIGRWGNFFNREAFGRPTDLPWGLYIPPSYRPLEYLVEKFFHPTFLYESLWDLLVFFLLFYLFFKIRLRRPGFLTGSYLILYSLGRFFIEGLRVDSFYVGEFRIDQITSLVMMIGGAFLLIYGKSSRVENN